MTNKKKYVKREPPKREGWRSPVVIVAIVTLVVLASIGLISYAFPRPAPAPTPVKSIEVEITYGYGGGSLDFNPANGTFTPLTTNPFGWAVALNDTYNDGFLTVINNGTTPVYLNSLSIISNNSAVLVPQSGNIPVGDNAVASGQSLQSPIQFYLFPVTHKLGVPVRVTFTVTGNDGVEGTDSITLVVGEE